MKNIIDHAVIFFSHYRHILDHAEFYQIARDVGSGMVYLHHHHPPVLHLNLKSMNVLLTTSHHAKIADFGFSKLKLVFVGFRV